MSSIPVFNELGSACNSCAFPESDLKQTQGPLNCFSSPCLAEVPKGVSLLLPVLQWSLLFTVACQSPLSCLSQMPCWLWVFLGACIKMCLNPRTHSFSCHWPQTASCCIWVYVSLISCICFGHHSPGKPYVIDLVQDSGNGETVS